MILASLPPPIPTCSITCDLPLGTHTHTRRQKHRSRATCRLQATSQKAFVLALAFVIYCDLLSANCCRRAACSVLCAVCRVLHAAGQRILMPQTHCGCYTLIAYAKLARGDEKSRVAVAIGMSSFN